MLRLAGDVVAPKVDMLARLTGTAVILHPKSIAQKNKLAYISGWLLVTVLSLVLELKTFSNLLLSKPSYSSFPEQG